VEVPLDAWDFESHLDEFLPLHGKVLALPPSPATRSSLPRLALSRGWPSWAQGLRDLG